MATPTIAQWILGFVLILSSLGVILVKKPVHASLSFLLTLLALAGLYLQLHAEFIAVMQVLVYAGAILVLFMFVIILFQDAHSKINQYKPESSAILLFLAGSGLIVSFLMLAYRYMGFSPVKQSLPEHFGSVEGLGKVLYLDFFFPFEAVVLIFLVAVVGALYIGKKEA